MNTVSDLVEFVCDMYAVEPSTIYSLNRKAEIHKVRALIIGLLKFHFNLTNTHIAQEMNRNHASIHNVVSSFELDEEYCDILERVKHFKIAYYRKQYTCDYSSFVNTTFPFKFKYIKS